MGACSSTSSKSDQAVVKPGDLHNIRDTSLLSVHEDVPDALQVQITNKYSSPPRIESKPTVAQLERMLDVCEFEIFPKTEKSVHVEKNKAYGAAVLKKDFGETIVAETNHEMDCPIYHGEVCAILEMAKIIPAEERKNVASEAVFVSTHQPSCMAMNSIVWSGFRKIFYLFPYSWHEANSKATPYEISIMDEVMGVPSYQPESSICSTSCIVHLCREVQNDVDRERLRKRIHRISKMYEMLTKTYHSLKDLSDRNNLAFR